MNKISLRRRWLLGGILSLVLMFLFWGVSRQDHAPQLLPQVVHEYIDLTSPIAMRGISYQEVTEKGLAYSLKADEFKIHPRSIGIFSIQPWKEATLTNAVMEVHLSMKENPSEVDLFPSSFSSSLSKEAIKGPVEGVGVISRLVIKKLQYNLYRDKQLIFTVTANEAISNLTGKNAELKDVQIEHKPSRKLIKTNHAVWDATGKIFKIPGEYLATTPKGTAKGYGIKVDLDFKVKKISLMMPENCDISRHS